MSKKRSYLLKRSFDIFFSSFLGLFLFVPVLIIFFTIKITSSGSAVYWSKRIGKDENIFLMPKFRTMKEDTPAVATHLLGNIDDHLTSFGSLLRKTSLDELPQLYSIFKGDMSFVGPRPALYNQEDLISLRRSRGVHILIPGLTGWAQINGRDSLPIIQKVELDAEYLQKESLLFDLKIIFRTLFKTLLVKDISH
jgi:O-antigen biosynthesis protein WbqP